MPLPFDFYLPEYNLIIEFDGDQHYRNTEKFGKNGGFERIQKHDKMKNEYCEKNNIHLLRLTYDDLVHNVLEWSIDMKLSKIFVDQLLAK
jgi:very-short-patch-repair endonuclease